MRYRALVGIKGTKTQGKSKAERENYQIELMKVMLKRWNSTEPVPEYWDPWYRTDEVYASILQRGAKLGDGVNIDNPLEVMNYIGRSSGHRFYTSVPESDRKARSSKMKEYENQAKEYKDKKKAVPEELKAKMEELKDPVPAEKTKLYAYCVLNPDGMFSSYTYPIEHEYNGISVESSKLANRNYGTMHDILYLGDLDFEATYLPTVVFRHDGEIYEGDDPDEIQEFLFAALERDDYVAIIECEA